MESILSDFALDYVDANLSKSTKKLRICVLCSTLTMSSFPLEIDKNIQAMKTAVAANPRWKKSSMAPIPGLSFEQISPCHFFCLFLVPGRVCKLNYVPSLDFVDNLFSANFNLFLFIEHSTAFLASVHLIYRLWHFKIVIIYVV